MTTRKMMMTKTYNDNYNDNTDDDSDNYIGIIGERQLPCIVNWLLFLSFCRDVNADEDGNDDEYDYDDDNYNNNR